MTREQIIAITKLGAKRATAKGFAATPIQSRHAKRLAELKRRSEQDRKQNEEAFALHVRMTA
ncbi:hypothetical protein [Bradyrhizobium genomosp. III]|uniref:hypothetical protein n=1 Tax=Bradyrhizobium genomosp. III TaxID=2683271 RepID=UPI0004BB3AB1|nr:hypothetical protein [Bradyrhizobium sp. CCBAU 15544]